MKNLFLIRHPRPAVAPSLCYGHLDVELYEPAITAVAGIRPLIPGNAVVWSSPLRRCRELAQALHPSPLIHPDLREMSFGEWEGKAWSAIEHSALNEWAADVTGYTPPGGESAHELLYRAKTALQQVLAATNSPVVVVTHAGVMRALLADRLGLAGNEWLKLKFDYCQVVPLTWDAGQIHTTDDTLKALNL